MTLHVGFHYSGWWEAGLYKIVVKNIRSYKKLLNLITAIIVTVMVTSCIISIIIIVIDVLLIMIIIIFVIIISLSPDPKYDIQVQSAQGSPERRRTRLLARQTSWTPEMFLILYRNARDCWCYLRKKGFEANSNNWLCKCCWNNLILRGGQSELASEEGDVRAGGGQVLLVPADHVHPQEQRVLVSIKEVAAVRLRSGDWVSRQCPARWKISPAHNHGSSPSSWRIFRSCLTKVKFVFLSTLILSGGKPYERSYSHGIELSFKF